MEKFNYNKYIQDLGYELINSFEKAASGTTPGIVGGIKEKSLRDKFKGIFPANVGVGSGFVINLDGDISKQSDIILYEENICPKFRLEADENASFYPCESVIAIGEVKSSLGKEQLDDAFEKINSVKSLVRYSNDYSSWRKYFNGVAFIGSKDEIYDQINKEKDQVYGFIICEKLSCKIDTFLGYYLNNIKKYPKHCLPNILISLNEGVLFYLKESDGNMSLLNSYNDATGLYFYENSGESFKRILKKLSWIIKTGRTTQELPINEYIKVEDEIIIKKENLIQIT